MDGTPMKTQDDSNLTVANPMITPSKSNVQESLNFLSRSTASTKFNLHPSMIPFAIPLIVNKEGELVMTIAAVNHNTVQPRVVYEIVNNMTGNSYNIENTHENRFGDDMYFFAIQWQKNEVADPQNLNTHCLRTVAIDFDGEEKNATYYLSGDNFDPTWFQKYLDNGGKDYFSTNATTTKGMNAVAQFNEIDDWQDISKDFEKHQTPIHERMHALAVAVHTKGTKGGVYLSPREGMHRTVGDLLTFFGSNFSEYDGIIRPGSLTYDHFKSAGLQSTRVPDNKKLIDVIEVVLKECNQYFMISEMLTTNTAYVNHQDVSADQLSKHNIIISETISNNKITSATHSPFKKVGDLCESFVLGTNEISRKFNPDFSSIIVPTLPNNTNVDKVRKKFEDASGDEMIAFPYCPILDDPKMVAYMKDPFEEVNVENIFKLLTVPSIVPPKDAEDGQVVDNETLTADMEAPALMRPPFLPTYQSLAYDVGSNFREKSIMSPETANSFILAPPIMTILFAAQHGKSIKEMIGNEELLDYISYYLKYHCNSACASTTNVMHAAFKVFYGRENPPTICEKPSHLLGATHFIIAMVNSSLTIHAETGDLTDDNRKAELTKAARLIGSTFATMDAKRREGLNIDDAIIVLSTLGFFVWEYADYVSSHIQQHCRQKNKCKKPWLAFCIWKNIVFDVNRLIKNHGLYPVLNDEDFFPQLKQAESYLIRNDPTEKVWFGKLISVMSEEIGFSTRMKQFMNRFFHSSDRRTRSMLPVFVLFHWYRFAAMKEERGSVLKKGWYMGASVATKEDIEFPRPMRVMGQEDGGELTKIEYFRDCSILDERKDPRSFELNAMFAFTQFDTRGDSKSKQLLEMKGKNLPSFSEHNVKLALVDISKYTAPQKKLPSAKKKKSSTRKAVTPAQVATTTPLPDIYIIDAKTDPPPPAGISALPSEAIVNSAREKVQANKKKSIPSGSVASSAKSKGSGRQTRSIDKQENIVFLQDYSTKMNKLKIDAQNLKSQFDNGTFLHSFDAFHEKISWLSIHLATIVSITGLNIHPTNEDDLSKVEESTGKQCVSLPSPKQTTEDMISSIQSWLSKERGGRVPLPFTLDAFLKAMSLGDGYKLIIEKSDIKDKVVVFSFVYTEPDGFEQNRMPALVKIWEDEGWTSSMISPDQVLRNEAGDEVRVVFLVWTSYLDYLEQKLKGLSSSDDSNNDGGIDGEKTSKEINDTNTSDVDGNVSESSNKQKSIQSAVVGETTSPNDQQENTSEKESATVAGKGKETGSNKRKSSPKRSSARKKKK